ncbi:RDD family protein [Pedobacter alpinus]|uniref:RDD family protein n=1 Tax=Pedobacter alpinus TaxID=1590643 RepID=A0ABW5TQ09_9SPHI
MENLLKLEIQYTVEYPGVAKRVKALFTDMLLIILFMMLFTTLFAQFETVADEARIIAIVFIFLLYDPLFTSFTGATIGQRLFGLRVRDEQQPTKNINFFKALVRFLIKAFLGWISLLTVKGNEKRKAMHDMAVGSVVVEVD